MPAVTDGDGVVLSLAAHKIDVEGKKLLLIGAGGSAAAAARALADRGAKLCFANRTQEKARESASRFGGKIYEKGVVCDGILSFVPVFDRLLFADEKDVAAAEFVLDAYYFRDTRLLQCARKYGKSQWTDWICSFSGNQSLRDFYVRQGVRCRHGSALCAVQE